MSESHEDDDPSRDMCCLRPPVGTCHGELTEGLGLSVAR